MVKRRATKAEREHMAHVATLPCLVCGDAATVHHVTAPIYGGRFSRSHYLTVPLCPVHHLIQHGPRESVEALGHEGFHRAYNIDLLSEAERIARENNCADG